MLWLDNLRKTNHKKSASQHLWMNCFSYK